MYSGMTIAQAAAMASLWLGREKPTLTRGMTPSPTRLGWKWMGTTKFRALLADPSPNFSFPLASRILVSNLVHSTSESSLRKEFSHFGQVAKVKVIKMDEGTGGSRKAYAFVQYTNQDAAILALETMDRTELDGRLIYVELAKPGRQHFGRYPRATGPPKKQPLQSPLQQAEDLADCWY